jgi:hypothetical protein
MSELAEPDERAIRQYVESQSPKDDPVTVIQQVGSQRILGRVHDLYDVHCAKTRWWVITNPTNLYQQSDFPQVDQALIFHIGLGALLAERSRGEMADPADQEQVTSSWRRFRQAIESMNDTHESEDFQAVGVKCRDSHISLARDHAGDDWVGKMQDPPKVADFKGWANIFADQLTGAGRLRSYFASGRRPSRPRSSVEIRRAQPTSSHLERDGLTSCANLGSLPVLTLRPTLPVKLLDDQAEVQPTTMDRPGPSSSVTSHQSPTRPT